MSRSVKKGPFVEKSLKEKIDMLNSRNEKKVVKTWSRPSMILPIMVGHRLGEFAATRSFRGHGRAIAAAEAASATAAPGAGAPAGAGTPERSTNVRAGA